MPRLTTLFLFTGALAMAQAPSSGTGRLDFRVATTQGDPVAAASVTVEGPDGRTYSGATGADGHWRVADLPPGLYKFRAFDAPGYIRYNRNFLEDVFVHAGNTTDFGLQLIPAKIHGRVTDEDGKPIEGATVEAVGAIRVENTGLLSGSATTDSRGLYLLALSVDLDPSHFLSKFSLPVFDMQLSVKAYVSRERAAQTGQAFYPYTAPYYALIRPNANKALDFQLRATPVFHIKGRIVGTLAPDQAPTVWITHCGAPAEATLPVSVAPRADGSFDADGTPPAFYCVELRVDQLRSPAKMVRVIDRDIEQVELAVPVPELPE